MPISPENSPQVWGGGVLPTAAMLSVPKQAAELDALTECRTVLADLDWSWRDWPATNPTPKPSRAEGLPDAEIRRQTEDLLHKESALRVLFGVELDGRALQTEMNRIALDTRAPDRLRAQFEALRNDAEGVANCIARPLLIERRLREGYAHDARWHGELRRRAEAALTAGAGASELAASGGREQTLTLLLATEARVARDPATLGTGELHLSAEEFALERARLLPTESALSKIAPQQPAGLRETAEAFIEETLLSQSADRLVVRSRVWAKQPFEAWWSARRASHEPASPWKRSGVLSLPQIQVRAVAPEALADTWRQFSIPSERDYHTAVWTGTEMLVWGGRDRSATTLATGGRYNPATDSWTTITTASAPSARHAHTAVWTGTEMIVWGGTDTSSLADGGRYNPATNSWTATVASELGARHFHTAVWTGSDMIVWGGYTGSTALGDGARYRPATNTWTAIAATGAPGARYLHTAVWTGSEMIVWGGAAGSSNLSNGGRYNPATNSWTATATSGAPSSRYLHTAVWTDADAGSEMIVWGGFPLTNSGGRYNPATNSWTTTPVSGAPDARYGHTAVWTTREMVVWGGTTSTSLTGLATGGRFDPVTNTWTATSTSGTPLARVHHTAVWTGLEMIVWGGYTGTATLASGSRYHPPSDTWTATADSGAAFARYHHTAIWTGSEMIVWGGTTNQASGLLDSGGRYQPATNSWTPTTINGAPAARYHHTAVWTGSEMIVWGGAGESDTGLDSGGRYNPATNSWTATVSIGSFPRQNHTAVWTGSEMVIWGGRWGSTALGIGHRYDPATNSWRSTTSSGAPGARHHHTAVWTGSEMIVWGGDTGSAPLASGSRYDPATDRWSATTASDAPSARFEHTAVWTGSEMIVWGGYTALTSLASGSRYNPVSNSWSAIASTGAPGPRGDHTAVWTGREMIVWGGRESITSVQLGTGGRYHLAQNSWEATSTSGAPGARRDHTAVWTGQEMLVFGGCCALADLGVYFATPLENSTTTILAITPQPSQINQAVAIEVAVTGVATQPADGQVVISASTGESCTDTTPIAGSGTTALFFCPIAFATEGLRNLTAVYTSSATHFGSSSASVPHQVGDLPPSVSISVSPALVLEDGATNLTYTVTRSASRPTSVVVSIATAGTATAGLDYSGAVTAVTIPAGATTATIVIDPVSDNTLEPNETVTLTVTAGTGYTIGAPASATGVILNDDPPELSIDDVTRAEGNAGTVNFDFTVSLNAPAGPAGVRFDIGTADGTAMAGPDYVARSLAAQVIPAGSSSYGFTVQVNGDTLSEANETFFVNVTGVTGASVINAKGIGTITNDDAPPNLAINDVVLVEGHGGNTNAVFTVSLDAPSGQPVSVNFATANATATQPADYTATSGTVVFAPGQTSRTLEVPVRGEIAVEPDETYLVNLSAPSNAVLADGQGVGTILDDDTQELVQLDGFETPLVNGPAGALQIPGNAMRSLLDAEARPVLTLDDRRGPAAWVYARVIDGHVEYALASRQTSGRSGFGNWQRLGGEPTLRWVATADGAGWRVLSVTLD